ncbi:isopentenyl-diphosphate Delta-isomerase [Daejeonella lutea]|uniref:Isopentenyl-diphosphate delta-isomerase n=1 Tax=Daejeonella lutea TaxID=572036 RepID=A0A1T5AGI9_9SPHI|nr:isopentenyl-diphosphate Delta-isomerase [Daejeonella lutea]SKB34084.1 isopentenyl-diphosphate delta-isomerase [Daejeonella lutea]
MNTHDNDDELLVLVDENDVEIGVLDKTSVHKTGVLHRAFSVFIFNSMGFLMLQRRALQKYHSPGLWSNTCCSHPRKGEDIKSAGTRRIAEEMGLKCPLNFAFSFTYRAELENGLIEHEFDHVYFGFTDKIPKPNPDEVMDWKLISMRELQKDILAHPDNYTEWLKICLAKVVEHLDEK